MSVLREGLQYQQKHLRLIPHKPHPQSPPQWNPHKVRKEPDFAMRCCRKPGCMDHNSEYRTLRWQWLHDFHCSQLLLQQWQAGGQQWQAGSQQWQATGQQ